LIGSSLRQANQLLIDPNPVYRLMVLAKGLLIRSRYCSAGTDKVASRAVPTLKGLDLTAFVVSFASAMRQLECKSGVSPRFPLDSIAIVIAYDISSRRCVTKK